MFVIPAIDLRGGKCVRLHQGDYNQETIYGDDPVEVARGFVDAGAKWIHVVDLDGAKAGTPENLSIIQQISALGVCVEVGGGIRTLDTIRTLLGSGVSRVILGSILLKDRELSKEAFGVFGDALIAGLDVREEKIAISGWQDQTTFDLYETAEWLVGLGCERFIVTDIATDGTLAGPNLALASRFLSRIKTNYIVSGGVGSMQDVEAAAKLDPPAEAIIVGKAIYDGRVDLAKALKF